MEEYKNLEVYKYLKSLYIYFLGDLKEFESLAETAEMKEITEGRGLPISSLGSMYDPSFYDKFHINKSVEGNESYFRLTIPITLSLFAVIDLLGFLTGENKDPLKTNKNFRAFFKISSIKVNQDESDFINQIFRQGLTHVYFPKLNLGIKYHSTNPKNKLFFRNDNNTIFLNANQLQKIVVETFEMLLTNENQIELLEEQYQTLINFYEKKHRAFVNSFHIS